MPGGPWLRTWLGALLLIALGLGGLEWHMRRHRYQPSVKDDVYAWAWQRARVSDGSPRTVAILGASRIHLAFSPSAFAAALPGWKAVQLAIDGSAPIGSLRDLAADPDFRGVALVDILEHGFARENWHLQDAYLHAYRDRWQAPGAMAERWLATRVQSQLALLSDTGVHAIHSLWREPRYVTTFPDRMQFADYALTDVAARRQFQLDKLREPFVRPDQGAADRWLASALAVELAVAQIQARGGKVVYLRMPTCDERWAVDQEQEPRASYWNRLAAVTHATAIHFDDYATLRDFACPDTSHIASKDGPRFTRALIDILVARGVIAP